VSFHPRHIAERYGLFTIIVLGESVLAVALGPAGTDWRPSAVLTAEFGFVVAACVWWLYFEHVGSEGIELGPRPSFYWGYGHLAVYAGSPPSGWAPSSPSRPRRRRSSRSRPPSSWSSPSSGARCLRPSASRW
jgi:Bacterial low temperature requirement A protein (LtrA)